jgi:hypothetical protein
MPGDMIRVKLISRTSPEEWRHQLPHGSPIWGRCSFIFDRDSRNYDWLVVYDDIPPGAGEAKGQASETLACDAGNSILVTTEPSSIKIYGNDYTRQFGAVFTSQEEWALPHPCRIYSQPALHWFYGVGSRQVVPFDVIAASAPQEGKARDVSMVFSPKSMRHTLHWRRHEFMKQLMDTLPEIDVYGRGARPLDDKAEALDAYRYHVAIENFIGPHHWTEKLADAFLGLGLPFYCGCPNATDYFPAESFIPLDLQDPEGAARIIRQAISNNEYEKRLPAIIEARRRVLFEYNLFAVISREIERLQDSGSQGGGERTMIYSRHALRKSSLAVSLRDTYGKVRARAIHLIRK